MKCFDDSRIGVLILKKGGEPLLSCIQVYDGQTEADCVFQILLKCAKRHFWNMDVTV